jgi:ADP-ribosylglycohydrolase
LSDCAVFAKTPEEQIKGSGYVVETLEAVIWCLLNTDNYKNATLKAVNLGMDTDTVAAITGGIAGLYYGMNGIPSDWLATLQNRVLLDTIYTNFIDRIYDLQSL